jgi:tripartite-type tricarboxylate transporter receptor subunit TctC
MKLLNLHRRHLITAALALAALPLAAQAQNYPTKAVRVVVPFGPGGVGDLTARAVAAELAKTLGQPFVIENRPGAGGVVAAETVAKAEPDGHTLFLISSGTAVSATLMKSLPYDTLKDFASVSTVGNFDIGLLVPADSPFKTLGELLAWSKANPGKLNIGSINIGSTQHLAAELFKSTAGVQGQVVPFNGTPALVTALRGKQVDVAVEILGPVMPQITSNAVRALAVTGKKRSPMLPSVPTAEESGVKDLIASSWNGFAAPAKTPRDVVVKLNKAMVSVLAMPELQKRLRDMNVEPDASTPEEASAILAADVKRWGEVIEKANIPRQ